MDRRNKILKAVFDFLGIGVLLFLVLFIRWGRILPNFQGYFENDNSIRYPFLRESISFGLLMGVGCAVIFITILLTESLRHKHKNPNTIGDSRPRVWLFKAYEYIALYMYGFVCSLIVVYMFKYALGTLRPHFYDRCRPRPITDQWSGLQNSLGYIRAYTCENVWWWSFEDIRLSFPSSHASYAMYSAVFFILYVERKAKWQVAKMMRHLGQFAALVAALYVGTTRLSENYSHASDVAAGFVIGGVFAVVFFFYFVKRAEKPEKAAMPNTEGPATVIQPPPQYIFHPQPTIIQQNTN